MSTNEILAAAERIRAGGLVAFPTETVYGLGANALDPAAVRKIFALKGRPATSPLIVHVDSLAMARSLAAAWPDEADRLAAAYWPGPLTIVVRKRPIVPDEVTAGLGSVGLRMPDNEVALELIHAAGVPIAAPSANRFTELSPTTAEHVRQSFPDLLVLDGGPCRVGIESTVVSLAGGKPVLLRPGMIGFADLESAAAQPDLPHPSPGMHDLHYAPRTPLVWAGPELPPGLGAYLWIARERPAALAIRMPEQPEAYAARLYAALHDADAAGLAWIAVEPPPAAPEWAAIRDRLTRAARR